MNAPKWSPSLLAMFTRPFGQILEVSSGEVPGQVALQWSDVDLVGDATPQRGERITFHLSELPDLIKALERAQETHAGLQ
jgi:hypothetical protein